jgi:hypothetical protein
VYSAAKHAKLLDSLKHLKVATDASADSDEEEDEGSVAALLWRAVVTHANWSISFRRLTFEYSMQYVLCCSVNWRRSDAFLRVQGSGVSAHLTEQHGRVLELQLWLLS